MMRNVLITALVLTALAGCGGNNTAMKPLDPNQSPDLMVKDAVEKRASLTTLAGKGTMRIVDAPSKFGLSVNTDIVADENDRLRIKADKLGGSIQAFDVAMLEDDIGFYIPTQKTLYHGKVDDLQDFAFRFQPDAILRQMLRPDTSLLLKSWRRTDPDQYDPKNAIILVENTSPGKDSLRLAIDQRSGVLMSVAQINPRGDTVLVSSFGDYRVLNRGRKHPSKSRTASQELFPYRMSLSWPNERRSMEMQFKSVEGDAIVLDEDFDLATSDDTRYRPLREAAMDEPVASRADDTGERAL